MVWPFSGISVSQFSPVHEVSSAEITWSSHKVTVSHQNSGTQHWRLTTTSSSIYNDLAFENINSTCINGVPASAGSLDITSASASASASYPARSNEAFWPSLGNWAVNSELQILHEEHEVNVLHYNAAFLKQLVWAFFNNKQNTKYVRIGLTMPLLQPRSYVLAHLYIFSVPWLWYPVQALLSVHGTTTTVNIMEVLYSFKTLLYLVTPISSKPHISSYRLNSNATFRVHAFLGMSTKGLPGKIDMVSWSVDHILA